MCYHQIREELMEIRLIGTGTCVPRLKRRGPSTLIREGGEVILVDTGLGALHGLLEAGVSHHEITHLLFTHLHPDHTAELLSFFFAANYDLNQRSANLKIVGGVGIGDFLEKFQKLYGHWVEPAKYNREVVELSPWQGLKAGELIIEAGPASHTPSSISFRVSSSSGVAVVLTGDSAYDAAIAKFARGADLLISDASFPEGAEGAGHMSSAECALLAREAGAGALILNHIYPDAEEVDIPRLVDSAGCKVILSEDGLSWEL
ncbi:MAG: hypothetical protein C0608_05260 [Deltaproteobacteria bacterium]|nr:MAG: hypothetical protein C0608_05260 [Deltaproteobacteria bacterium]